MKRAPFLGRPGIAIVKCRGDVMAAPALQASQGGKCLHFKSDAIEISGRLVGRTRRRGMGARDFPAPTSEVSDASPLPPTRFYGD